MATIVQIEGSLYQEVHPFMDAGWIKFHRSLITQVIPDITSVSVLKVLMLFLEQTTDGRGRDVPAELSIRLIARMMKLSPTSAEKAVKALLGMKIVRLARPGDRVTAATYELNRDFILLEPVNYVTSAPSQPADSPPPPTLDTPIDEGVSTFDTPADEGVSTFDTPADVGVPKVDTPTGKKSSEVYQLLVQDKDNSRKELSREDITGARVPSLLERQGYSPEPPIHGKPGAPEMPPVAYLNRLPRTLERMGVTPERMRELAARPAEELSVPGLYTGDAGRPWEGLSPAVTAKYPCYVWMLNVLALVCRENLTDGESAALAQPLWKKAREWVDAGRTPPQVWARFGDPEGYWYASEDHGWKGKAPTLTDVARKWDAAVGPWRPLGARQNGVKPAVPLAEMREYAPGLY